MKVLKFGGTSVGSVESMSSVKHIVESCREPVIVVVSALGGITDKLIGTAKIAVEGGNAYEHGFREIVDRHIAMIHGAVDSHKRDELLSLVEPLLDELGNIFKGVSLIKDLSVKTLDTIVSYGERLSLSAGLSTGPSITIPVGSLRHRCSVVNTLSISRRPTGW